MATRKLRAKVTNTAEVIPLQPASFYDPARDGVTFSLLSTFLECRQKARLFLRGWSAGYSGFHLVMGSVLHFVLQRVYDDFRQGHRTGPPTRKDVMDILDELDDSWKATHRPPHPKALEVWEEVMMKAEAILPAYFEYWADEDFKQTTWLEVEETFKLDWKVTTKKGVTLSTFLRGRIDGAYTLPKSKKKTAPRLFETKGRSHVDEGMLVDTMPHERQINTYLSVLRRKTGKVPATAMLNIIRKPLLRQKQGEDWSGFKKRIEADVRSRMDWYFIRMEMAVSEQDINRSEEDLNDLISDFLLWWAGESGHYKNSGSCAPPGKQPCQYLRVCAHGDFTGLEKRRVVFRELEDE